MKQQSSIFQIRVTQVGHISVDLSLDFLDDKGSVIGHRSDEMGGRYHSIGIECGGVPHGKLPNAFDRLAWQIAQVNAHLAEMGWPEISAADIADIQAHAAIAWTPEKVSGWNTFKANQLQAAQTKTSA